MADAETAADRETARQLMKEGRRLESSGEFASALRFYRGADSLMRLPTTSVSVARMLARTGRLVEASETAHAVVLIPNRPDEEPVQDRARTEAMALERDLEKRIARIQVRLEGPLVETLMKGRWIRVHRDGVLIPVSELQSTLRVDPGKHTVEVSAPRHQTRKTEVVLAEGQTTTLTLPLVPVRVGEDMQGGVDSKAPVVKTSEPASESSDLPGGRDEARERMKAGRAREAASDFAGALAEYEAAHRIVEVPTTGLAVARMLDRLGRLIDARDTALGVLRLPSEDGEPPVFAQARDHAAALAASLETRIGKIVVQVESPPAGVVLQPRVDDSELPTGSADLPRAVDPGAHDVCVRAAGYAESCERVTIAEAETRLVSFKLIRAGAVKSMDAASPDPDKGRASAALTRPPQRAAVPWWSYAGFGIGAAGIGTGALAGWIAMSKSSSVRDSCNDNRCPMSAKDEADRAYAWSMTSNVAFGAGLIGIGVGLAGVFLGRTEPVDEKRSRQVAVWPSAAPGLLGVAGAF